jgi:hypothetical protein
MSDPGPSTVSEVHSRAICDEIGERLRVFLDRSQTPTPPKLQVLLLRLQLSELKAGTLAEERQLQNPRVA